MSFLGARDRILCVPQVSYVESWGFGRWLGHGMLCSHWITPRASSQLNMLVTRHVWEKWATEGMTWKGQSLPSFSFFSLILHHGEQVFSIMPFHHVISALGSVDHGLKLWAKINLSSLETTRTVSVISSGNFKTLFLQNLFPSYLYFLSYWDFCHTHSNSWPCPTSPVIWFISPFSLLFVLQFIHFPWLLWLLCLVHCSIHQ